MEPVEGMMNNKIISENGKALAIMAHDLKAPLSAIVSLLGVINKGYVNDMDKARELVGRASHKAELLIAMVDDILDYTLLADKQMMKRELVNILEILDECASMMKPYAEERKIALAISRDLSGEMLINGNYTFLMRAFNNIIGNAVKYNKENGSITIDYSVNTKKNSIEISVADTGIGIPEDEMDKVFKIFERGKYARRNINGSIGLGMSLVKQIFEDHDGVIALSSAVGVGTTVSVTLPLYKDTEQEGGKNEL
jgi:two-component system phosphate regulon sensor histidine kinase PhoR